MKNRKSTEPVNNYGIPGYDGAPQSSFDRAAFIHRMTPDCGCPPRMELFKRIAEDAVPGWFEWHSWTERCVDALCNYTWTGLSGCGSSAKTFNVVSFACLWWQMDPENSSVILCSTTTKALKKRGWREVQRFFSEICSREGMVGNFVDSQMVWQSSKGDNRNAITGIAVEEGSTFKVADNIKGIHTRRQMVIIDEATAVPSAIWDATTNLYSHPEEFILVAMGNPRSRLDQFGRFIEPLHGWESVSVDDDEWETKPQMDGQRGICVRFDFVKSPNIIEGKVVSVHLPKKEKVAARMAALKDRGGENDPLHWSNDRGFPAPEGLATTVFTETMLDKYKVYDRHQFMGSNFFIIGALDPAFGGGARPALRFAAMGDVKPGVLGIEWMAPIILYLDAKSKETVTYQLIRQCQQHAENVQYRGQRYRCLPENFGFDASALQVSFGDAMQREWSPKLIRIQFNGETSREPRSLEDPTPANEVYRNKRAEMYFRTQDMVTSGQLKGVDKDTAVELCQITYSVKGGKIVLIDKKDYAAEHGNSPDYADCGVQITEVAIQKGFHIAATGTTIEAAVEFDEITEKANAVYEDDGFGDEQIGDPYDDPVESVI